MLATDHSTAVLGVGLTGTSCVRFLQARGQSCVAFDDKVSVTGQQKFRHSFPAVTLVTEPLLAGDLNQFKRLLVSPGIPLTQPAIVAASANRAEVSGDIDLFCEHTSTPMIAITGSNGKSTVTALLGAMAQAADIKVGVGGNIGIPALDLLSDGNGYQLFVLELSSYQLERTTRLSGHVATVLNISPDHMDRYRDLAAYQAAKLRIYRHCRLAVFNRNDRLTQPMMMQGSSSLSFGSTAPQQLDFGIAQQSGQDWLVRGQQWLLPVQDIALPGAHNAQNALAALALGDAAGIPMQSMLATLRNFKGLAHRCEYLAEINGVAWYDDSKGTNVGATLAAVAGMQGNRIILIAGGVGKGADFSPLTAVAGRLRAAILIGEAAADLAAVLTGNTECHHCKDMDAAVVLAGELAEPGDTVLLSPACASFDMFVDYHHRGQVFAAAVLRLAGAA